MLCVCAIIGDLTDVEDLAVAVAVAVAVLDAKQQQIWPDDAGSKNLLQAILSNRGITHTWSKKNFSQTYKLKIVY